jgi:hypothetical protein
MAVSRTHRYAVDPADLDQLIARRATLIAAVRAAHPSLTQTRLTRLEDGTCTDVWRWDSAEQMRAALADMPRLGVQAGAGMVADPRRHSPRRRHPRRAMSAHPPLGWRITWR